MCRNIRTLHNFAPPATEDEIRAAALQYVRKVSGSTRPSKANEEAFAHAVEAVAAITAELLDDAGHRGPAEGPRDRGRQGPRPLRAPPGRLSGARQRPRVRRPLSPGRSPSMIAWAVSAAVSPRAMSLCTARARRVVVALGSASRASPKASTASA